MGRSKIQYLAGSHFFLTYSSSVQAPTRNSELVLPYKLVHYKFYYHNVF